MSKHPTLSQYYSGAPAVKYTHNGDAATSDYFELVGFDYNVYKFTITILPPPEVNLSVSTASGTEAAGTVVTVTATSDSAVLGKQKVTLTASGSGITAGDYTLSKSTITIPNGTTSGSVQFTIQDDNQAEVDETAILTISNPSSGIVLGSTTSQTVSITDDNDPTVSSITRTDSTPSNAASVAFTVTFSENVSGVDTSDFSISGIADASVSAVSAGTCSPSCTVTVNTGTGAGTIRLDLTDDDSIATPSDSLPLGGAGAGNGNFTSGESYTIDKTAPAAPSAPDLSDASDTGSSNSDNVTSDTTPDFSGGSAEISATVELFYGGSNSLGTTTADGSGNWSITATAIPEGSHNITATVTDAAGNTGAASSALSITIDTTVPDAPSIPDLTDASDTGSSKSDNVTSDTTPDFSDRAEANATVELFYGGSNSLGTTTADGSGDWTITATTIPEGLHNITATATDAAGNTGAASGALALTIDITNPNAVCQDRTVHLSDAGTASITDSDVDGGSTDTVGIETLSASPNSFSNADTGDNTVVLTVTDAAGNIAACNATVTIPTSRYLYNEHGGTWHDADKDSPDDDDMCWAAAASNLLAWGGWDAGYTSSQAIFDVFEDHWQNEGGKMYEAWEWWTDGTAPGRRSNGAKVDADGAGGYYVGDYSGSVFVENMLGTATLGDTLEDAFDGAFGVTLGLLHKSDTSQSHALTVWGYETDAGTGELLGLHVTDSDDGAEQLVYVDVEYNTITTAWDLQGGYSDWSIYELNAFGLRDSSDSGSAFGGSGTITGQRYGDGGLKNIVHPSTAEPDAVPEPASVLLVGLGLLALCGRFLIGGRGKN